jgi:hypothetical protein
LSKFQAKKTYANATSINFIVFSMPKPYVHGEILPPLPRNFEAAPPAEATLASNEDNVIATGPMIVSSFPEPEFASVFTPSLVYFSNWRALAAFA